MKRISWLLMIILLVNSVFAGIIYDIDFSEALTHIVILNERDAVRFDFPVRIYENKTFSTLEEKRNSKYSIDEFEQRLMIRNVNKDKESTELTLFIYGAETPQYFTLAKDNMIKVDFERDNIDDMIIGLNKIEDNRVALILQKVSILNKDDVKEKSFLDKLKTNKNMIYYIIGGIIILFLIAKQRRIREYFAEK